MKRSELEKYLGKRVKITLFDKREYVGELHKTGEECFKKEPNLMYANKYYFLINPDLPLFVRCQSCLFKCSHVTKLKEG